MPTRAAKEAARLEQASFAHADEDCSSLAGTDGPDGDEAVGRRGKHHGRHHHGKTAGCGTRKTGDVNAEVFSVAGNKIAELRLSVNPTAVEMADGIAALSNGVPIYKQRLIVNGRVLLHPHMFVLDDRTDEVELVEQFIVDCGLSLKVATKLRLLDPCGQKSVLDGGVACPTMVGMRIHDAQMEKSAKKNLVCKATQSLVTMKALGELCEAEASSLLRACLVSWQKVSKAEQKHEDAVESKMALRTDGGYPDCGALAASHAADALHVTLVVLDRAWQFLRIRPVGVPSHWCVITLRVLSPDGKDMLVSRPADPDVDDYDYDHMVEVLNDYGCGDQLSSSKPYDDDSRHWGCAKVMPSSGSGSFFHAEMSSQDTSWIQYRREGFDVWPSEIHVKQYARDDTWATRIIVEASADGNYSWGQCWECGSADSPPCPGTLTEHDVWTIVRLDSEEQ